MRQVIFGCAMSLDGYIAGPHGEFDWIVMDPDIDFARMQARFDTFLIGRKTYEAMGRIGGGGKAARGVESIVCSRTMNPSDYPKLKIRADAVAAAAALREKPGKDIAIFGGGELFGSLLEAGVVDGIAVSVIPVLLGGGVGLLPEPARRAALRLRTHRVYPKTGTVLLEYEVKRG